MELTKEEIKLLQQLRDANVSKDTLIAFTQIINNIISKR